MDQKKYLTKTGITDSSFMKKGYVICLYFSAHWCPPCKSFTPILANFYKEINRDKKRLEIIFMSMDKTEQEFKNYFSTMPWLAH